ncbi:hypothetical protein P5673_021521 [Acropora cervicornis]|uniref:Uncharacterized protein n=1 Tax=Acropora cervicornis TaxID=6130 RepID=A0AAD9Q945_ACRCE|nr:hypothetical protein P5673_021521 [Acropora cervicornis]
MRADKEGRWPCLGDRYCHRLAFCNMKIKRCQCKAGLLRDAFHAMVTEIALRIHIATMDIANVDMN